MVHALKLSLHVSANLGCPQGNMLYIMEGMEVFTLQVIVILLYE
jgi:hypothetical protein